MDTDGVVLVIGCGMQRYREYLLASAATRHRLWLFLEDDPDWQRPYIAGSTKVEVLDRAKLLEAATELAAERPVVGVLSWDETLVVGVAHVAGALGLPGTTVDGIEGCRDKHRSRKLLTDAGLAQPRYGWAESADDAAELAAGIGYPVVVKPRGMGASIGVVLAADEEQARSAFAVADEASQIGAVDYRGGALIEEYLDGPEISVDAAVVDGEYLPMFLARKQVGLDPYFEEIGHVVDPDDPLLSDPGLLKTLAEAHRAAGVRYGITHTEVKLVGDRHVIVEINGRLGGDLIPLLGRYATGIDPGVAVVEVALGERPVTEPRHRRTVGIRFGYPPFDCTVRSVAPPDTGVLRSAALVEPGTTLRLPPGGYISRHSYVICDGDDPLDCAARLDAATARVRLDCEPLDQAQQAVTVG